MKAKEKRNPHSYKCIDKVYKAAARTAKKDKTTLSKIIETFIEDYANLDGFVRRSLLKTIK